MERIKKVFVLVHCVIWTLFSVLIWFQMRTDATADWVPVTVGFLLTCAYVFYTHFYLLTKLGRRKKSLAFYLLRAGIMLTGPLLFVCGHYQKITSWNQFYEFYFMAFIIIAPIFLLLSWAARVLENLVLNTVIKEQLEKQAAEAELHYLKSQINPHFLFNTLHNIHTLVYKQAATAPDAVLQLASLMRYMLYESNSTLVPLSREVNYLQDYISLQQLRYKTAPVADVKIDGNIEEYYIAPLLFVHLMENAYKHSPARLEPGDIKVSLQIAADSLTFLVQNPVAAKTGNKLEGPGGIGLQNVQKRLQLLYPEQHTLDITDSGDTFAVTLKIKGIKKHVHETKTDLLYH